MAIKTFLLKNSAAPGSSHGSLQDGGSVTTATSATGYQVGTTASTNYGLQSYNSIVTVFNPTPEPSIPPNTTDSWRSESALTGTFAAGNWNIYLSVIASIANATGSGSLRVRVWKSANADGSSATELTSSAISTTPWSNLTTTTSQNLNASASIPQTDFNNEYLFVQLGIEINSAGANSTSEVRNRIDSINSKIDTTQFNFSYNGEVGYLDAFNVKESNSSRFNVFGSYQSSISEPSGTSLITYYAMRAIDPDCPTLTYVSWVVTGSPDLTGSQYTGPRCGASPLQDITISSKWQVE